MFRKLVVAWFLAIALVSGCTETGERAPANPTAPDFTLQDMSGRTVRLSDYRGKVVLLEFWATWCPPCRASIPGLKILNDRYRDKGLVVLAVSVDVEGWDVVRAFVKRHDIDYTVLQGTDEVEQDYRVRTIPMMLVLDKQGRIYRRYLGYGNDDQLEQDIKASL
jgi:peroxiredoxin